MHRNFIVHTHDTQYRPAAPEVFSEILLRRFGQRVVHVVVITASLQVVEKKSQLFRCERDHKRLQSSRMLYCTIREDCNV